MTLFVRLAGWLSIQGHVFPRLLFLKDACTAALKFGNNFSLKNFAFQLN